MLLLGLPPRLCSSLTCITAPSCPPYRHRVTPLVTDATRQVQGYTPPFTAATWLPASVHVVLRSGERAGPAATHPTEAIAIANLPLYRPV